MQVPEVLGSMQSLYMLSFKANKVKEVPEASLPTTLGAAKLTPYAADDTDYTSATDMRLGTKPLCC